MKEEQRKGKKEGRKVKQEGERKECRRGESGGEGRREVKEG